MAKILIELDDTLLGSILTTAAKQQFTLDTFIADSLKDKLEPDVPVLKKNANMQDILETALERASAYAVGQEFYLDDLIPLSIWDSMSGGKRKSLGKTFRKEAAKRHIAQHNGRTSGNKAIYIRQATKGKMVSVYLPLALVDKLESLSKDRGQRTDTIIGEALTAWMISESSPKN